MDAKVDKSSDKMRERLNTIERRLKSVNTHMQHLSEQAEKMLRGKLDAARHKLQAQKEHIEKYRANHTGRAEQEMAETEEVISARKERQETEKPSARADWAETGAANAIDHAEARIEETEGAMLYAAVARLDSHAGE